MKRLLSSYIYLAAGLFLSLQTPVTGRTYKTISGVPLEASLVEVKKDGKNELVVLKADKTNRIYEIPLASLSLADQKFIKTSAASSLAKGKNSNHTGRTATSEESALPAPSGASGFPSLMSKLVAVDGRRVRKSKIKEAPDYYAFYFAASWCPSCSRFTPQLVDYYSNNIAFADPRFEIIFVSRDGSKKEMENYMLKMKMPWPAINYADRLREKLRKKYAPSGTPSLVLVDRAGKVISESFVDGKPRGAFAVKQDIAYWFTGGERDEKSISRSRLTSDKRVSGK